ncbi:MAG: hypothetical protein HYX72_11015 [Acidobacteria bacterium]|nr:hypothetical protein [Acidobacteriota bacterium]
MVISKNSSAAIVVDRDWANLAGVRIFLRRYQDPSKEVKGSDTSHLILAKILESEDRHGLWVEMRADKVPADQVSKPLTLMIPWTKITAIALTEDWTPALQEEMRQIGFVGRA